MKQSPVRKEIPQQDPMEVALEDREVALARSADVKGLIADFLEISNKRWLPVLRTMQES